jgi:hypothetical protein
LGKGLELGQELGTGAGGMSCGHKLVTEVRGRSRGTGHGGRNWGIGAGRQELVAGAGGRS